MTVVLGLNYLTEVVVVADTRMSWPDGSRPPQDILRKLYTIGTPAKPAILGFSGDYHTAKTILTFLWDRKFKHFNRRFVIGRFSDDLHRWIEEAATTLLTSDVRKPVSFMFSALEPSRHPSLRRHGQNIGTLLLPEVHIYVYKVNKDSGGVAAKRYADFAVIGSGREVEDEIRAKVRQLVNFALKQPNLHWARAYLLGAIVSSLFQYRQPDGVGGPFQVIRVSPEGLQEQYLWPPNIAEKSIEVRQEGSTIILLNPALNERYTLYPFWEI